MLLIFLTVCSEKKEDSGERYGTMINLDDKCDAVTIAAEIDGWLKKVGIKNEALVMLTSDGASVMLGKISGVAQRLRNDYGYFHLLDYHCVCHRESLAVKDACKVILNFNLILINTYVYF